MKSIKLTLCSLLLSVILIPLFSRTLDSDTIIPFEVPEGAVLIGENHYFLANKYLFFLDGKSVSPKVVIDTTATLKMAFTNESNFPEAIFHFGEKARSGIFIFESIHSFTLKGKIEEKFNNKPIMLFTFKNDTINSVDTAMIKNGEFIFYGKEYLTENAILSTGNYPDEVKSTYVILEQGDIQIDLTDSTPVVRGTPLNEIMNSYNVKMEEFDSKFRQLESDLTKGLIEGKEALSLQESIIQEKYLARADFVIDNISNLAGKIILKTHILRITPFPRFNEIYALMNDELKSDTQVMQYIAFLDEYEKASLLKKQEVGKQYIDFELETPTGELRKLSDYVGKSEYLLIDFWASWCGPCIAEMPHLKNIYEKYNEKGLEIISISLDDTKEAWQKGLDRIDAPWVHLCGFRDNKPKLMEAYNILGVPYAVLFNKEGRVIQVNSKGKDLTDFLEENEN